MVGHMIVTSEQRAFFRQACYHDRAIGLSDVDGNVIRDCQLLLVEHASQPPRRVADCSQAGVDYTRPNRVYLS